MKSGVSKARHSWKSVTRSEWVPPTAGAAGVAAGSAQLAVASRIARIESSRERDRETTERDMGDSKAEEASLDPTGEAGPTPRR
jgi:hypothetical protein